MKCLSLWQPWASLIVLGYKRVETRSWSTPYRGLLVIHAAKRSQDVEHWCEQPFFRGALTQAGLKSWKDLPFGAALGTVRLVEVRRTEHCRHQLSSHERAFGNYEDGRWAWFLADVQRFREPIPMRGMQGLFAPPPFIAVLADPPGRENSQIIQKSIRKVSE